MFWLILFSLTSIPTAFIILLALISAAQHDKERVTAVEHLQMYAAVNAEDSTHDETLHQFIPLMTDRQPAYST